MKRALCTVLLLGAAACEGPGRRETDALSRAVERFRLAEDRDRTRDLKGIEDVVLTDADVAKAKDRCLGAARATTDGIALVAAVKPLVEKVTRGDLAKDSPEALSLNAKLDKADALLRRGKDEMPLCDQELAALKRKHGI